MKLKHFLFVILLVVLACSEDEPAPIPPIMVENFETTINENPSSGLILGTLSSTGGSDSKIFSLINEMPSGALNIDAASGEISVADETLFDFEINPQLTAEVLVEDDNSSDTATIIITLNDVDEDKIFTVWNGAEITFTKSNFADPNLEANQDRISADVWITRGNSGGQIFNIKSESSSNKSTSPTGTKWAEGVVADIPNLEFENFRDAITPKSSIGKNLILYLVNEDVYIPIKFNSWTQGSTNGGGFSYTRATEG